MRAKKSYGQHFLNNEPIAEGIANSLILTDQYSHVIEVGPGQGVLTKYLLQKDHQLYAVEADRDMIAYLEKHYPAIVPNLIFEDFLKLKFQEFLGEKPFAIIGNFPYNISSQIVFKMLDFKEQIPELVGMFQKEMAERIISPPGSKTYGVIAVLTQAYYNGEYLMTISPDNFNPPPRVQSAVIRLTRKDNLELGCNPKLFKSIVKQTFGQRRKMLRNTMKSFLTGSDLLETEFFKKRPERITVAEFVELTNIVENFQKTQDADNQ